MDNTKIKTGERPFWETKSLAEMTFEEWESLCDRCGQCCLHKIEDDDTGEVFHTIIACRLLNLDTCTCENYENRMEEVTECLKITPVNFSRLYLLPESCTYRRLSEGKTLPSWHPLHSHDLESIHRAGISVRGKVISEEHIHPDDFEAYIKDNK